MAFQFPADPVLGQTFSPAGGPTYRWNGTGWMPVSQTYGGGLTFTGPVLFADGTLAAPGVTWANEQTMGLWRVGPGHVEYVVSGAVVWGLNATTFGLGSGITFNVPGTVNLTGTVNAKITGGTTRVFNNADTTQTAMAFHWAGQGGQPDWIWGGDGRAPGDMYVWQASALNVNYANSANTSNYSANSGQVGGIGPWNWSNRNHNPVHLWANDGATNDQFLVTPGNLSVNYANYSNAAQGVYHGGGGPGNTRFVFHWADPGWHPNYLWGSSDGTNMYVFPPGRLNVNSASNAGYANNSGQVNGVGNWSYSNYSNSPTYVWATNGDAQHQFLCHVPSMSVNYANSAGSVSGVGVGNIARTDDGSVQNIRVYFDGEKWKLQVSGNQGTHEFYNYTGSGGVDGLRAKDNIVDSATNASAAIGAVRIIEFDDKLANNHVSTGFLPANLEEIDLGMVYRTVFPGDPSDGPMDTLNVNPITVLAYAVKALQEIIARVEQLEAK